MICSRIAAADIHEGAAPSSVVSPDRCFGLRSPVPPAEDLATAFAPTVPDFPLLISRSPTLPARHGPVNELPPTCLSSRFYDEPSLLGTTAESGKRLMLSEYSGSR